jgi:hypothetical protein
VRKAKQALGWCRSNPARTTIIVIVVEIVAATLLWIVGDLAEDYTNISSYILFWVVVLFASIAAVGSVLASMSAQDSLDATNKGLELTRASMRPFLNVMLTLAKDFNRNRAYLYAEIENTGDFPADGTSVKCEWYIQGNETIETQRLQAEKEFPSVIFPGVKTGPTFLLEEAQVDRIGTPDSRVCISVSYKNKLTGKPHETRRTFRFVYAVGHTTFHQIQAVPIPEEDYWD